MIELTFVEEQVIKFYRQLSSLGKANALVYLESVINEEKEEEKKKKIQEASQKIKPNYESNSCRDCKYLSWEMEGSICKSYKGTQYGRCSVPFTNKMCPYYKKKD